MNKNMIITYTLEFTLGEQIVTQDIDLEIEDVESSLNIIETLTGRLESIIGLKCGYLDKNLVKIYVDDKLNKSQYEFIITEISIINRKFVDYNT